MAYIWNKNLEIGDSKIDEQHRQLVDIYNSLLIACKENKGFDVLEETLDFMVEYAEQHLADEEALQRMVNFPEQLRHKALHEDFKRVAIDLIAQFKSEGPTPTIVIKLNAKVGDWLINHIQTEDAKISAYL